MLSSVVAILTRTLFNLIIIKLWIYGSQFSGETLSHSVIIRKLRNNKVVKREIQLKDDSDPVLGLNKIYDVIHALKRKRTITGS